MLSIVLVVSIAANLTGAVDYDPWLDVTDDGYGGIDDIVSTAEHFGASGDPTKLCNITNWPISDDVNVWWGESLGTSTTVWSSYYEASGFGDLHLLAHGSGLITGESVEIKIWGRLVNPTHTASMSILVYSFTLNPTTTTRDITISVPSGEFRFSATTDSTSTVNMYLSFYLTWA
jgi:hypothetical protein